MLRQKHYYYYYYYYRLLPETANRHAAAGGAKRLNVRVREWQVFRCASRRNAPLRWRKSTVPDRSER